MPGGDGAARRRGPARTRPDLPLNGNRARVTPRGGRISRTVARDLSSVGIVTDTRETDLRRRLERLEQVEAIKTLKYRYWRACDAKDPKVFRDCFVRRGAIVDYGRLGTFDDADPMAEIFARIALRKVDGTHVVFDMHHGMHPEITVTGPGTATGRWTLRFRQLDLLERTEKLATGEYDDEYLLEDGAWKMSRCRFTETWSVLRPLPVDAVVTEGAFAAVTR